MEFIDIYNLPALAGNIETAEDFVNVLTLAEYFYDKAKAFK